MSGHNELTGRVREPPADALHTSILAPQFEFEVDQMLDLYVLVELVTVRQACAMGLLTEDQGRQLRQALSRVDHAALQASPEGNLSDVLLAIEQTVASSLTEPIPRWHVDRSRNDVQACVQRMWARRQLLALAPALARLVSTTCDRAAETVEEVMPGYTHYQPAQVISPAFYLAAVNEGVLATLRRLLSTYDDLNHCPLGAGAMAGLELPWDRLGMAHELGFDRPVRSALASVGDRSWSLQISFELAALGVTLSRFCTDLSIWGSAAYGFIDLPDGLVGISSAMPQKRNLTVLERLRGETGHLTALHLDFLLVQRNTPYTNLVEVSKEAGRHLPLLLGHARRVIDLLEIVVGGLILRVDVMRRACQTEVLAASSLANLLTLEHRIPHRTAQVIVGQLVATMEDGEATAVGAEALNRILAAHGYHLTLSEDDLTDVLSSRASLQRKQTVGSTNPMHVRELLAAQRADVAWLTRQWRDRAQRVAAALARLDPVT